MSLTCGFSLVSQRDLNPCLHLESVVRVESVSSAGGRKGTLTCGLSFLSLPVATPQFPTSCGIDTGSKGGGELQPPFSRSSGNAAHGEMGVVGDRLMDRPLRGGLSFRWCVSLSDQSLIVARLGGRAYSSREAIGTTRLTPAPGSSVLDCGAEPDVAQTTSSRHAGLRG
jgi:hypothetical protein